MHKQLPGFTHGLLLIGISVALTFIVSLLTMPLANWLSLSQAWIILINYTLTFGLTLTLGYFMLQINPIDIPYPKLIVYIILIFTTLSMNVISEAIVSPIPMPDWLVEYMSKMVTFNLPGYLTVAIAAALLEELIFRGLILKAFLKRYSPKEAIIFSAILFAVAHVNPWQIIPGFIAGVLFGWVFYKTRSVWPGVFMHWINNSFSFYIGYKYSDINTSFFELSNSTLNYTILLISAIAVGYLSIKLLNSIFNKERPADVI